MAYPHKLHMQLLIFPLYSCFELYVLLFCRAWGGKINGCGVGNIWTSPLRINYPLLHVSTTKRNASCLVHIIPLLQKLLFSYYLLLHRVSVCVPASWDAETQCNLIKPSKFYSIWRPLSTKTSLEGHLMSPLYIGWTKKTASYVRKQLERRALFWVDRISAVCLIKDMSRARTPHVFPVKNHMVSARSVSKCRAGVVTLRDLWL